MCVEGIQPLLQTLTQFQTIICDFSLMFITGSRGYPDQNFSLLQTKKNVDFIFFPPPKTDLIYTPIKLGSLFS